MSLRSAAIRLTQVVCALAAMAVHADRPLALNIDRSAADWLDSLESGGVGSYAIVGDSISFRKDSYNWVLRDILEERYGNAGDGYLAFNFGFRHAPNKSGPREGLDYRKSGATWALSGLSNGARDEFGQRSPDGIYSRIGATGWIEVDFYGVEATLHYIREPGAGIIRVKLNGDVIAEIDASAESGPPELGLYTFDTNRAPDELNTLRLSLVDASADDPQWTQLNGLDMRTGRPGALYHRLARGGAGPDNFLEADLNIYGQTLRALAPELLILMVDPQQPARFRSYVFEMNSLLDFYAAALPETEIILLSHHAFDERIEQVTDWELEFAIARGLGFINLFDLHEGQQHLQSLGFLADYVHLSTAGGQWFGRYVDDVINGWVPPTEFVVEVGDAVDGGLYESRASDDDFLVVQSWAFSDIHEPYRVRTVGRFEIDHPAPNTLELAIELALDDPGGQVSILLRNHDTGQLDRVGGFSLGVEERVFTITGVPADPYLDDQGQLEMHLKVVVQFPFVATGFRAMIDHLRVRAR